MRKLSFSTFAGALLLGAAVLTSAPARSQSNPAGSEASQHADALFRTGKELYKSGKLLEAYEAYRAAWRLKQTYDIATNLANTEFQLAKMRDAAEHYAFSIKNFPPTGGKAQLEAIKGQFDEVRRQVGAVVIKVNVEGAEVSVDGAAIGRAPLVDEQYVAPGERTVGAKLSGYEPVKQTIQVAKGAAQPVTLTLVAVAAATAATPSSSVQVPIGEEPPHPAPTWKISPGWLIAGGVLAVGGLAAGIGFTAATNGKASDVESLQSQIGGVRTACGGEPAANITSLCAALRKAAVDHDTFAKGAVVTFALGGAFALGTAGLALWASPKSAARPRTGALHVLPVLGSEVYGATVVGAW